MATLDRIAKVESRCTPAALAFLRELASHPCFADLVAKLEQIDNALSRADVEDAFAALLKGTPPTND
ncbi:MAG: hypothetical protein K0R53_2498 [Burkholderiales bacterium]|jgi:hypothetical protein|nr:hypothetical protein [Burkholderiales bacterium]